MAKNGTGVSEKGDMARRYRSTAKRRGYRARRRNSARREEGLGGLLAIGALAAWHYLGPFWSGAIGIIAAALIIGAIVARKRYRQRILLAAGIAEIDQMPGHAFEERLAAHFRQQGCHVDLTPYQGDFGADILIERDGIRTAIQAKRWRGAVGVAAVQEIVGARGYYGCQGAMVVTNSRFTAAARQLAAANKVVLWDRATLISELAATPDTPVHNQQLQW